MEAEEFSVLETEYSKKLSECKSGIIAANKGERLLLVNAPQLCEKEKKFFYSALGEMRRMGKAVNTKADIYFFLKEHFHKIKITPLESA